MQSLQRRIKDVFKDLKDALSATRSSPSQTGKGCGEDESECNSEMSDGLNAPLPKTVDEPVKKVAKPPTKSGGNACTAPVQSVSEKPPSQLPSSIVNWRNHSVDVLPMDKTDVASNIPSAPSGSPVPNEQILQPSNVANIISSPAVTAASIVEQQITGNDSADDEMSASSDGKHGILVYNPSHRRNYNSLPSSSTIEKAKAITRCLLIGLSWDEYVKPSSGFDFTTHPPWIGFHADRGHYLISYL